VSYNALAWLTENEMVCNSIPNNSADVGLIESTLGGQFFESDRATYGDFSSHIIARDRLETGAI